MEFIVLKKQFVGLLGIVEMEQRSQRLSCFQSNKHFNIIIF